MKMRKARRVLEGIAKWSSFILAAVILAVSSFLGFRIGSYGFDSAFGVVFLIIGVVLALLATGWVFAISRLNGEVEAMRRQLAAHTKPE